MNWERQRGRDKERTSLQQQREKGRKAVLLPPSLALLLNDALAAAGGCSRTRQFVLSVNAQARRNGGVAPKQKQWLEKYAAIGRARESL